MKNNLKELRQNAGLSLYALGHLCGVSRQRIFQLEASNSNPRLRTAYKIAVILGVDVEKIWPNDTEFEEETITVRRVKQVPK